LCTSVIGRTSRQAGHLSDRSVLNRGTWTPSALAPGPSAGRGRATVARRCEDCGLSARLGFSSFAHVPALDESTGQSLTFFTRSIGGTTSDVVLDCRIAWKLLARGTWSGIGTSRPRRRTRHGVRSARRVRPARAAAPRPRPYRVRYCKLRDLRAGLDIRVRTQTGRSCRCDANSRTPTRTAHLLRRIRGPSVCLRRSV